MVGNPNVGKSTLFNTLTGDTQHTGNWTGKTVDVCTRVIKKQSELVYITDLPGTYSLHYSSPEEAVTSKYLKDNKYDCVIIVATPLSLERNLILTMQTLAICNKAVLCLNMADEHKQKSVHIDTDELSLQLGIPVVEISALKNKGIDNLIRTAFDVSHNKIKTFSIGTFKSVEKELLNIEEKTEKYAELSKNIAKLSIKELYSKPKNTDEKLDKVFTSRLTGIPTMLFIFALVFWLTVFGANYPGELLNHLFSITGNLLIQILSALKFPEIINDLIYNGIYSTVTQVISVMLPPGLIFFTLFAFLEESGYLSRIAFILDRIFEKAGVNGKLSITMLMGIGCNACAVLGCRINNSKRERVISVVTNSFIPCNGRFPTLIAVISIFLASNISGYKKTFVSAGVLLCLLMLSFAATLFIAWIFSKIFFRKEPSSFIMELPSYKMPDFKKVIVDTLKNKVWFVLSRAIAVSAPAGLIIWLLNNIFIADRTLVYYSRSLLNPIGEFFGLDGAILLGFLLAFPANEIVLPIIIMIYQNGNGFSESSAINNIGTILIDNNWTITTAVCVCVFCLFHFPCSTTCIAIKKETNSIRWAIVSILTPLTLGLILCFIITSISKVAHTFF